MDPRLNNVDRSHETVLVTIKGTKVVNKSVGRNLTWGCVLKQYTNIQSTSNCIFYPSRQLTCPLNEKIDVLVNHLIRQKKITVELTKKKKKNSPKKYTQENPNAQQHDDENGNQTLTPLTLNVGQSAAKNDKLPLPPATVVQPEPQPGTSSSFAVERTGYYVSSNQDATNHAMPDLTDEIYPPGIPFNKFTSGKCGDNIVDDDAKSVAESQISELGGENGVDEDLAARGRIIKQNIRQQLEKTPVTHLAKMADELKMLFDAQKFYKYSQNAPRLSCWVDGAFNFKK